MIEFYMIHTKRINFKNQERKIAQVFVSAFLFYLVFIIIADARKIFSLSASFHWKVVPLVLLFILANYFFRAFRFHLLLKKINIHFNFATSCIIFLSGIAMTVTPGKMGEIIKSYFIKQKTGHGYSHTIPLLIFERVMDGVAMIILSLGGIYFFPSRGVVLFFIFSMILVILFFMSLYYRRPAFFILKHIEKRFRFHFFHKAIDFFDHSRVFLNWKTIASALVLSIVAWALQGVSLYILVRPILSSPHIVSLIRGILYALFIFSFSSIAGFLAFIPAGIGVAEGSLVSFLVLFFHITFTQAVFISLIFRFTTLWFGVGLGVFFLIRMLKKRN